MAKNFGFNNLKLPISSNNWVDADERMFLACFEILGQFVEKELGRKPWDFKEYGKSPMYKGYRLHSAGDGEKCEKKAIRLWIWYSQELPKLIVDYNKDTESQFIDDENAALGMRINPDYTPKYNYGFIDNIKDKKLKELIKIRRGLWT